MFAAILDGMHAQDAKTTTNRREAAKLFNEHLKNQSDLGIAVTEESLSDAWNSNSGGVMQRHAPTQQRLQGIVAAQNKAIAEKDRAASFKAAVDQRTLYGYVETDINKALDLNRFSKTPMNNADLYESLTGQYEEGSLQLQELQSQTRSGNSLTDMQAFRDNEALSEASLELGKQLAQGYNDPENLKKLFPSLSLSQIEAYIARYNQDRAQVLTERDQANATYEMGVITWEGQQVTLKRQEQEAVTAAARLLVTQSRDDTDYAMKLAKAEKDVARELITDRQKDVVFKQGVLTYNFNFEEATKAAAQKILDQGYADVDRGRQTTREDLAAGQLKKVNTQTNLVNEQTNANYPAEQLVAARSDTGGQIDVSVANGTATLESITSVLKDYQITDPLIIKRTWEESLKIMDRATDAEMIQVNQGNLVKRVKSAEKIQSSMSALRSKSSENILKYFPESTPNVDTAIMVIANKYQLQPNLYVANLSDWIQEQINEGAFGKDATSDSMITAISAEIESPSTPAMQKVANQKPPTFSSQKQEMMAQAFSNIGVDQFTPNKYKTVHMPDVQSEVDAYLMNMGFAITNGSIDDFNDNKLAIADLILETNADLVARKRNYQKAFGVRTTQEEATALMKSMADLLLAAQAAADKMVAPEPPVKEVAYPWSPDLYTNTTGDLDNVAQAIDIIDGTIGNLPSLKTNYSSEQSRLSNQKLILEGAQASFDEYKNRYDELTEALAALGADKATERRDLLAEQASQGTKIRALQKRIGTIIDSLQQ